MSIGRADYLALTAFNTVLGRLKQPLGPPMGHPTH
jgi:hypothetical protein